jgi:hypothetical protein
MHMGGGGGGMHMGGGGGGMHMGGGGGGMHMGGRRLWWPRLWARLSSPWLRSWPRSWIRRVLRVDAVWLPMDLRLPLLLIQGRFGAHLRLV